MNNKVIDFKKSKEKLLNKRFPNVSSMPNVGKGETYNESRKTFESFQNIFVAYKEYLSNDNKSKEITLDEVLVHFNRYFDEIYKEFVNFDYQKTPKFKEILDYAMLSSGKRLRPFLIFLTYSFLEGKNLFLLSPFMVAMELIHTFSLIHDDLPCMDNDELRRGKPTVWKKYGEDMAVLAGDALYMQAMSILVETVFEYAYSEIGSAIITSTNVITKLAGLDGMIIGQVFDVINTGNTKLKLEDIAYMYDKKTSALLVASLIVGASLSLKHSDCFINMERLGIFIGEAYQIKDDLLEIESDEKTIGKSVDSDKKNGKVTLVSLIGIEKSKERLKHLEEACYSIIDGLTNNNNFKDSLVYKEFIKYLFKREKYCQMILKY